LDLQDSGKGARARAEPKLNVRFSALIPKSAQNGVIRTENRQMQASSMRKSPERSQVDHDVARPVATRSGKVLSLLIALEALRQQSGAPAAQKV
jgi:hypothetical protein